VKRTYDKNASCGRCRRWQKSPRIGLSWCELCGAQWSAGGRAYEYFLPRRRWPLLVAIIAIAAVLVLAASLLLYWAVIDPAHNPPARGEVNYTDVVLANDIPVMLYGHPRLITTRVLILGFGDNGTVYAVENDKPVMWYGGGR
jgi:hypothetical protein